MWVLDSDSAAKWKLSKNEYFEKMIASRKNEKMANIVVEVVDKAGYQPLHSSSWFKGSSGVTSHADPVCPSSHAEGAGDTFTSC